MEISRTDAETIREMCSDLDLREAQEQYGKLSAALAFNLRHEEVINHDLRKQCDAANKRLFALFEQGWSAGDPKVFVAYRALKYRLTVHHRWES